MNWRTKLCGLAVAAVLSSTAQAGSIYLTGHDVDFHGNQNGYSTVILDWLRGAGTVSEIAAASYDIGVLRSTGVGTFFDPTGFGTVDQRDPGSFASTADFATWLAGIDVLEIASHTSCGGCALDTADSDLVNGFAPEIAAFFNAGGDIWANTGGSLATYYDFLPPDAAASGASIVGSTGFEATAAGVAIGILDNMINGFPTHNRFTSFDPDFTVFEIRPLTGSTETISIGIRDAVFTDGGIAVPEPGTLALLGLAALGLAVARRRRT